MQVELDFLSPAMFEGGFSAGSSATDNMAVISWNQVLLYPKGWKVDDLTYIATLKLPANWKFGTPLPIASTSADNTEIGFKPVSLGTLVDSPVITGEFLKVVKLADDPLTEMDIAADSAAALEPPQEVWDHYKNLVEQANKLFGAHHYRDYHFLLSLSDHVAHFGLEHHESDDSRVDERGLVDETARKAEAGLLPHEYVHSWNGKYRRPADLATPDFQQPMKDDLLWVYEGLTEYLGNVLTARSGLYTQEQYREHLADIAATYEYQAGRTWRPLQDTADAASLLYFAGGDWENWRRGTDYYDEGELIWLEVDTKIRQLTQNSKSIDDFCKLFEGAPGGQPDLKTYTFDDVVAGLNAIAPNDWRGLLTTRLTSLSPHAPLGGIENGGWKLVYNEAPNEIGEAAEEAYGHMNLRDSMGLSVNEEGAIGDVIHGRPAYNAGIGPGMRIVAVNGRQFSPAVMGEAIETAKSGSEPINLLVANGVYMKSYAVDYHGGLRFPHLERMESQPDLLSDIAKPHATQ